MLTGLLCNTVLVICGPCGNVYLWGLGLVIILLYSAVLGYDDRITGHETNAHSVLSSPLSLGSHLVGTTNDYTFGLFSLWKPTGNRNIFLQFPISSSRIITAVSMYFKDFEYPLYSLETSLVLLLGTSTLLKMSQILLRVKIVTVVTPTTVRSTVAQRRKKRDSESSDMHCSYANSSDKDCIYFSPCYTHYSRSNPSCTNYGNSYPSDKH